MSTSASARWRCSAAGMRPIWPIIFTRLAWSSGSTFLQSGARSGNGPIRSTAVTPLGGGGATTGTDGLEPRVKGANRSRASARSGPAVAHTNHPAATATQARLRSRIADLTPHHPGMVARHQRSHPEPENSQTYVEREEASGCQVQELYADQDGGRRQPVPAADEEGVDGRLGAVLHVDRG